MERESVTEYLGMLEFPSVISTGSICSLILYRINSQLGLSLLLAAVLSQSINVSGLEQKLNIYKLFHDEEMHIIKLYLAHGIVEEPSHSEIQFLHSSFDAR